LATLLPHAAATSLAAALPPAEGNPYGPLWLGIQQQLQQQLNAPSFEIWIRPLQLLSVNLEAGQVTLATSSEFNRGYIKNHYHATLQKAFSEALNTPMALQWQVKALPAAATTTTEGDAQGQGPLAGTLSAQFGHLEAQSSAQSANQTADALWQQSQRHQQGGTVLSTPRQQRSYLNPRYTFEQLVVGPHNHFAHAAAVAIAEQPGVAYNPFFVYGGVGLGKTHLVQAIGHHVLRHHPKLGVRYVTTETFTNELITAIATKKVDAFRDKYRQVDVLILDDIQFLEGKEKTQEEVFHTFNALHGSGKQLILTSDRPPKALARLEERLISRFEWGLITDVQVPNPEVRMAILRKKAEREGLTLRFHVEEAVLEALAERFPHNVRELEGAFNKLAAACMLEGQDFDLSTVERLFGLNGALAKLDATQVLEAVAAHYKQEVKVLCGPNRSKEVAHARQVAAYLLRTLLQLSFPKIGSILGKRKHSTVLYAYEQMKKHLEQSPLLKQEVERLQHRLCQRV
jgi:chromosomal replication initiator protein